MRLIALVSAVVFACSGCSHVQPAQSKTQTYVIDEDASGVGAALGTGGAGHNCDNELNTCFKKCWESSRLPYPHTGHNEWYYEHCTRECRKAYMDCVKEEEKEEAERVKRRPPLEFSSFDKAREWIRTHKAEIALGTVVIVAGTAFIIATGGTGALILVPLAI
jgi:hypothetical protein